MQTRVGLLVIYVICLTRDQYRPPYAKIGTPERDSERRKGKGSGYELANYIHLYLPRSSEIGYDYNTTCPGEEGDGV